MALEKQTNGPRTLAKEAGDFRLLRSRAGKKRGAAVRSKDFWRVLSNAALSSPYTPVLRRFHD